MLPIKMPETRILKVRKHTHLSFQCTAQVYYNTKSLSPKRNLPIGIHEWQNEGKDLSPLAGSDGWAQDEYR